MTNEELIKKSIVSYKMPQNFNVEVVTFHKGQTADGDIFENHPELKKIYPSKEEVSKIYAIQKNIADNENRRFIIAVSEDGIKIHEIK